MGVFSFTMFFSYNQLLNQLFFNCIETSFMVFLLIILLKALYVLAYIVIFYFTSIWIEMYTLKFKLLIIMKWRWWWLFYASIQMNWLFYWLRAWMNCILIQFSWKLAKLFGSFKLWCNFWRTLTITIWFCFLLLALESNLKLLGFTINLKEIWSYRLLKLGL